VSASARDEDGAVPAPPGLASAPNATAGAAAEARQLLRTLKVFEGALKAFDIQAAPQDPMRLFDDWFRDAVRERNVEPHAMTLASVDAQGCPSVRTLILKDYDASGLYFASSARSRKASELAQRPRVALNFYWRESGRQIRIGGAVLRCSAQQSAADFAARSADARAEAMLGRQSQPLQRWQDWEDAIGVARRQLQDEPDCVAPDWALYLVRPDEIEFWQADRSRRHERLQYLRENDGWVRQMLWP